MGINKKVTERNSFELYFEWFMNELKDAGYIESYHREPFKMMAIDKQPYTRYNFSTKKPKTETYNIMRDAYYLMDYIIVWNPKSKNIFYTMLDNSPKIIDTPFYAFLNAEDKIVSICDVKPAAGAAMYGNNTTGYTFPLFQKIFYALHGIYINKVIPIPYVSKGEVKSGNDVALFTSVFCPRRYVFTDGGKQSRRINFRTRTMNDYIKQQEKELNRRMQIISANESLF